MSLIRCPECGTSISDKARTCPYCGYEHANNSLTIASTGEKYTPSPTLLCDGEKWEIVPISENDSNAIVNYFSTHRHIAEFFPQLAEIITDMCRKDNKKIIVVNLNRKTRELIEKGELVFKIDKKGNLLPMLQKADNTKITELVRLKEITNKPAISSSINNIATQVSMAQVMDELMNIENAIASLYVEIQQDRLALADSAWDKMLQARCIHDHRLKTMAILNAIDNATEAKRVLMRNFTINMSSLLNQNWKSKDLDLKAQNAANDLVALTNCVRIEVNGYVFLGENLAAKESLQEFLTFVKENKLNDRNYLLKLNENLPKEKRIDDFTGRFSKAITKIEKLVLQAEKRIGE